MTNDNIDDENNIEFDNFHIALSVSEIAKKNKQKSDEKNVKE